MKAAVFEELNQPLKVKDIDPPQPSKGEVVVKVKAAALNHRDIWIQKGMYPGIQSGVTIGSDGAGVVESTGEGADPDWKNREVIINPGMNWGENSSVHSFDFKILGMPEHGTFAEYVKVPQEYLHPKPAHLSWEEAASLPLAGVTAYRALFTRAGLKPGEKVLVTGIGGGVSQLAFPFAKAAGCPVYITSGDNEKIQRAMKAGAEGGFNYKEEDWSKKAKKEAGRFDVIIDSTGGEQFKHLGDLADGGGRITIYGGTAGEIQDFHPAIIFWKQVTITGSTMGTKEDFAKMTSFVEACNIKPAVDKTFALKEVNEAMERMKASQQFGKIVLKPE